jgi:hypothetical protein
MRGALFFAIGVLTLGLTASFADADTVLPQSVLYIGHRRPEFEPFLKAHCAKVEFVSREQSQPAQAQGFDVVLLDWPQNGVLHERSEWTPLGKREEWTKPTVLLGSAGLRLAVAWKLKGGAGCTCLAPVAYGLKDHEIFKTPIAINVKATTNVSTPRDFSHELKEASIEVLPLVDGIRRFDTVINDHKRGWCSYYYEFADVPEVEFFCSGINEKTPRASALWRQGNLLHFGFEQSPTELNDTGRAMLLNAIAYISRFTQDRPIDITPSVFGAEKIAESRRRAKAPFVNPEYRVDWATNDFTAATLASFDWRDRSAGKAWFESVQAWLHPSAGNFLEVDEEAKSLGMPFDSPEFLPKTIAALRGEQTRAAATALLARYAPEGPGAKAPAEAWKQWWRENSPYVFYSELGCYRWYIDPLAKKRGIPTKELRGPLRADAH